MGKFLFIAAVLIVAGVIAFAWSVTKLIEHFSKNNSGFCWHNWRVTKKEIIKTKNDTAQFKDEFYKMVEMLSFGKQDSKAVYVTYECNKCKCQRVDKL